jgi:RNA exonuclease 4
MWHALSFGSQASGLALAKSDLDVTCLSGDRCETQDWSGRQVIPFFRSCLKQLFEKSGLHCFEVMEEVFAARVPILRLRFEGSLTVDLSCHNSQPLQNTRLLRAYVDLGGSSVRDLACAVKLWAKAAQVTGAPQGHLSTYTFTLMVIYYLQVDPAVKLPCIEVATTTAHGSASWECRLPLQVLLTRFFRFYSEQFAWGREVVSIRIGRRCNVDGPFFPRLAYRDAPRVHVEDPVDNARNLNCVLGAQEELRLRDAFRVACQVTVSGEVPFGLKIVECRQTLLDEKVALAVKKGAALDVVAMDCEMVGVGPGGDRSVLARVSIVDHEGRVLMDSLVHPKEPVTDYRTHVTGITAFSLHGPKVLQFDVAINRANELLDGKVVVGHALQNDFSALMLSHPHALIRDTALYRPLRLPGGEMKTPSLRNLAQHWLHETIRTGGTHDSVEDARIALRLYRLHSHDWEKQLRNALQQPPTSSQVGSGSESVATSEGESLSSNPSPRDKAPCEAKKDDLLLTNPTVNASRGAASPRNEICVGEMREKVAALENDEKQSTRIRNHENPIVWKKTIKKMHRSAAADAESRKLRYAAGGKRPKLDSLQFASWLLPYDPNADHGYARVFFYAYAWLCITLAFIRGDYYYMALVMTICLLVIFTVNFLNLSSKVRLTLR